MDRNEIDKGLTRMPSSRTISAIPENMPLYRGCRDAALAAESIPDEPPFRFNSVDRSFLCVCICVVLKRTGKDHISIGFCCL